MKNLLLVTVGVVLAFVGAASGQPLPLWEPMNGPEGGWVYALYEHPVTHDIYAGLRNGGLWKSTDSGATWQYVALASGYMNDVVTGNTRGDIFASGGGQGGGLFVRSTDLGATWTVVGLNVGDCAVAWDSLLLYGTIHGLYRSVDYGETALRVAGTQSLRISGVTRLTDGSCLFGTWEGEIYRSTDAGSSWTAIADGVPHVYHFAQYGDTIYAVTNRDGVFRSTDGGFHWANVGLSNIHLLGVQVDTGGTVYVAAFAYGVYRSSNGGTTWEQMNTGLTSRASTALLLTSNHRLFLGTEGGQSIYRADLPFAGWEVSNHGLLAADVPAIAIMGNTLYAAKFFEGMLKTTDLGQSWQYTGLTGAALCVIAANETTGTILAGSYFGSVYRSADEGDSWTSVYVGPNEGNVVYKIVWVFGAWWAVTYSGLYRSIDDGLSWEAVFYCHYGAGLVDMAVAPTTQTAILVRERTLYDTTASAIFRSTDQGWTWSRLDRPLMLEPAVLTFPDGNIYVINGQAGMTTDPGFWISTDDGLTWTYRQIFWNVRHCMLNSQNDIFVEKWDHGGIYRSRDRGLTWEPFRSGIPVETWSSLDWYPEIAVLAMDDADFLYAGFAGAPIYRTRESTAGDGIEAVRPAPVEVTLSQNYPNPFNSITRLEFTLPSTQRVSLRLYDVLGREVALMMNEIRTAGKHEMMFDASGLPSGVYLCRLEAGGMGVARKIVLVK